VQLEQPASHNSAECRPTSQQFLQSPSPLFPASFPDHFSLIPRPSWPHSQAILTLLSDYHFLLPAMGVELVWQWGKATWVRVYGMMAWNEAVMAWNEAVMAWNEAVMAWNQAVMAWNQAVMAWNQAVMAWNEAVMAWNEAVMDWNEAVMAWNETVTAWNEAVMAWNEAVTAWNEAVMAWNEAVMAWNEAVMAWNEAVMAWEHGQDRAGIVMQWIQTNIQTFYCLPQIIDVAWQAPVNTEAGHLLDL